MVDSFTGTTEWVLGAELDPEAGRGPTRDRAERARVHDHVLLHARLDLLRAPRAARVPADEHRAVRARRRAHRRQRTAAAAARRQLPRRAVRGALPAAQPAAARRGERPARRRARDRRTHAREPPAELAPHVRPLGRRSVVRVPDGHDTKGSSASRLRRSAPSRACRAAPRPTGWRSSAGASSSGSGRSRRRSATGPYRRSWLGSRERPPGSRIGRDGGRQRRKEALLRVHHEFDHACADRARARRRSGSLRTADATR